MQDNAVGVTEPKMDVKEGKHCVTHLVPEWVRFSSSFPDSETYNEQISISFTNSQ